MEFDKLPVAPIVNAARSSTNQPSTPTIESETHEFLLDSTTDFAPIPCTSKMSISLDLPTESKSQDTPTTPASDTDFAAIPSTSGMQISLDISMDPKRSHSQETPNAQNSGIDIAAIPSTSKMQSFSDIPTEPNPKARAQRMDNIKRKIADNIEITPRKKKLMEKLYKMKCTLAALKKSASMVENLSSPILKEFVIAGIKNQTRKPRGKRWTTKNKVAALAIYKRSPNAYRYMQHILALPSVQTLQRIIKKIPMEPGINTAALDHLKKVAGSFKLRDRYCTLAFDEIALKQRLVYNMATDKVEGFVDLGKDRRSELANHALVFWLQGIGKKLKQPLAFYFVKGTISSQNLAILIKEVIRDVKVTGFNIISTICDQGPTNVGALNLLKEWHNGGDNYYEINNEKVFIIFDVPHLFKSIRNNFLNQGQMRMEGRIGKWKHLVELEEYNRNVLYLTKLTKNHTQPKYRTKMRVKYAAQILSQTVAGVLKLMSKHVDYTDKSDEFLQTSFIVENLNKLFDFTNGPSNADDVIRGKRENVSAKTNHVQVWAEFCKKLSTVKFVGRNGMEARNVKCIDGYIITLKSLSDIWSMLQDAGFKFLNLRKLNQDSLENLFNIIRQHSPTNRNPTCSSFMAALKTSIISGMTAPHNKGANCEKDNLQLMTNFHELVFGYEGDKSIVVHDSQNEQEDTSIQSGVDCMEVSTVFSIPEDVEDIDLEKDLTHIKEQPLVYVSGYIAFKIIKHSKCSHCKESLSVDAPTDNSLYALIKLREWWPEKQSLTYPSLNLCRTVEKAINIFEKESANLHKLDICQYLITLFFCHIGTTWFQCTEHPENIKWVYEILALMLVRRQCQRINQDLALKEEDLADANKKAQQFGVAK